MAEGVPHLEYFLKEHKLESIYASLQDVVGIDSVEDFYEMNDSDVRELASEIGLKVGQRSKLIRAIKSLPGAKLGKTDGQQQQMVVVCINKSEREALDKLAVTKKELQSLIVSLKTSKEDVETTSTHCKKSVNDISQKLISQIESTRDKLLAEINSLTDKKLRILDLDRQTLVLLQDEFRTTKEKCNDIMSKQNVSRGSSLVDLVNKTIRDAKLVMDLDPVGKIEIVENAELAQQVGSFVVLKTNIPPKQPKKEPKQVKHAYEPEIKQQAPPQQKPELRIMRDKWISRRDLEISADGKKCTNSSNGVRHVYGSETVDSGKSAWRVKTKGSRLYIGVTPYLGSRRSDDGYLYRPRDGTIYINKMAENKKCKVLEDGTPITILLDMNTHSLSFRAQGTTIKTFSGIPQKKYRLGSYLYAGDSCEILD